jgi:hypothetical protein
MFSTPGYEATGASKEKPAACVPNTAPIVTTNICVRDVMLADRHRAVVTEVHIDVEQASCAIMEVTVKFDVPNLRPVTVTD